MQYSSDFTIMMREAGYIYPFGGWRRRRMDRDYEEPQGIRISVDDWIDKRERYIAQRVFDNFDWEHFYAYVTRYNKRHYQRLNVRPGLECPPRKLDGHVWTWQEQFENDVWYVENVSFQIYIF